MAGLEERKYPSAQAEQVIVVSVLFPLPEEVAEQLAHPVRAWLQD